MDDLFLKIRQKFESNLSLLEDKPEETIDSTIKALWNKAYGISVSAEKANHLPLPELSEHQKTILLQLSEKRINGIPLAYLTERQNFMGIELLCDNRALIPRKETEILAQTSLDISRKLTDKKQTINMLDVCCGSGNIGISIATLNVNVMVHASDLSVEAVELTQENISFLNLEHQVQVRQSDLFNSFNSEKYWNNVDLIVSNPPYISSSKVAKMNSEIISNEPVMAFDGGMIGIKIIQKLIHESPKFLTKNGWLVFEVGLGQGPFIIRFCEESNRYKHIESFTDYSGNIRVIAAKI